MDMSPLKSALQTLIAMADRESEKSKKCSSAHTLCSPLRMFISTGVKILSKYLIKLPAKLIFEPQKKWRRLFTSMTVKMCIKSAQLFKKV